jgi:hypothetical protein
VEMSLINQMDPTDETPQFDHGGRSKRPRTSLGDPFMDAIPSRTAHTPLARTTAPEPPPDEDGDCDESQALLTQPPSPPRFQQPSSPSSPTPLRLSTTPPPPSPPPPPPVTPPPPVVSFDNIPDRRKSVINRVCSSVFSIDEPRDFQL